MMKKGEKQDVPTIFEIIKKNPDMTYNEANRVQENIRLRNEESEATIKRASGAKKEDRGPLDLTLLVEQHAKEIWDLKEQLSEASKELTVLRGTKNVVTQLSNELVRMKKRAQEAEGDSSIIKGISHQSDKQREINELNERIAELLEIDGAHQKQMGEIQVRLTDVEEDNKKLSKQITDATKLNRARKAGM